MTEEHTHDCPVHSYKLANHEERLNRLDEILDKVRNRLPVWATIAFALLLGLLGFLASGAKP